LKDAAKFQRTFIIFRQEDKGYGIGQEPSGYVKIEIRDGKGRLDVSVQNLKEDTNKYSYRLLVLKPSDGSGIVSAEAGEIPLKQGRGEISWEFDPSNVANTGSRIDEFQVFAVVADFKDKEHPGIVCPMAAYRKAPVEWRKQLESEALPPEEEKPEADFERQDAVSKYSGGLESIYIKPEKAGMDAETGTEGSAAGREQIDYSSKGKEGCVLTNGLYCGKQLDSMGMLPCSECGMMKREGIEQTEALTEGDIEKLKACLNKDFPKADPFRAGRRDYKWWKVNSPVQLNNILYQCGIRTPLLFNPSVMMAHFKYRHLIVGIYTDRTKKAEYIVFGIPGVYRVDDRPYGDMCRWVQIEGNRVRYGAFGYWIVYIEPKSSKILSLK
jgi:hypothetical protein